MQHKNFFDSLFCSVRSLNVEQFTTENNHHHFQFRRVARLLDEFAARERGRWPRFYAMPVIGLYHDLDQYLLVAHQSGSMGFTLHSPIVRLLCSQERADLRLNMLSERQKEQYLELARAFCACSAVSV